MLVLLISSAALADQDSLASLTWTRSPAGANALTEGLSASASEDIAPDIPLPHSDEALSKYDELFQTSPIPSSISPPAAPLPPGSVIVHNEHDLAQQITAATGPSTTTLLLPSNLLLSQPLPPILGPVQLISRSGAAANVTCQTSTFTALTVNTSSFGMTGLKWVGCGTVLILNALPIGIDSNIRIASCSFVGNRIDPFAVS